MPDQYETTSLKEDQVKEAVVAANKTVASATKVRASRKSKVSIDAILRANARLSNYAISTDSGRDKYLHDLVEVLAGPISNGSVRCDDAEVMDVLLTLPILARMA